MKETVKKQAELISELAIRSMLYEVSCFPSPGLVSPFDSGAHMDMDYFSFLSSIPALFPYIEACAAVGLSESNAANILPVIRKIGLAGEERMFQVTSGINTQKGQMFLHGIIAAAAGYALSRRNKLTQAGICDTVALICQGLLARDFSRLEQKKETTRGERLYMDYGFGGIRREVEQGLPTIREHGYPALIQAQKAGLNKNDSIVHVLLAVMCRCEDSNIAGKYSPKVLNEVRMKSGRVMAAGGMLTAQGKEMIHSLHKELNERRISPGGAADLTAATFFISLLEEEKLF